jgi:WD40 repeat protein
VQLWQVGPGPDGVALVKEHNLDVDAVAFSHDFTTFALLACPEGDTKLAEVQVRDLATGAVRAANKQVEVLPLIGLFAFSPDGRFLLVKCGKEQVLIARGNLPLWTLHVRDAGDGLNVAKTYKGVEPIFAPDGKCFVLADSAGGDLVETKGFRHRGALRVNGDQCRSLRGHPATVAFSPDSKMVLITGQGHEAVINPLRGLGRKLFVSKESLKLINLWGPAVARLWDAETAAELAGFDGCTHGLFSPDGKLLAARYQDGVRVWDVPPRKPVGLILGLSAALWGITVTGACLLRRLAPRDASRKVCPSRARSAPE